VSRALVVAIPRDRDHPFRAVAITSFSMAIGIVIASNAGALVEPAARSVFSRMTDLRGLVSRRSFS
jgi:hypothetical protein